MHISVAMTTSTQTRSYWVVMENQSTRVVVISGESIQVGANGKGASVTKQCCNDSHKNVLILTNTNL